MFFGWLRRKAAEAVVLGVGDGLRAVTPDGEEPPCDLEGLRALAARQVEPKALAAGDEDEDDVEEADARPVAVKAAKKK